MNGIRKIQELSQQELELNVLDSASWHAQYSDTSYIYIGGLPFELKEEDIIVIFSQYGVPTNIKLLRDRETGESKGFCYLEYEDHRSTVLLVDNFNGIKLVGRTIKVDHCYYKPFTSDNPEEMEKERQYQERMKKLLMEDDVTLVEDPSAERKAIELKRNADALQDDDLADPMADYLRNKELHDRDKRKSSTRHNHHHDKRHRHRDHSKQSHSSGDS